MTEEKLRLQDITSLAQGQPTRKWQNQASNRGSWLQNPPASQTALVDLPAGSFEDEGTDIFGSVRPGPGPWSVQDTYKMLPFLTSWCLEFSSFWGPEAAFPQGLGHPLPLLWPHTSALRLSSGCRHDAVLCQQVGQERFLREVRPIPGVLQKQRGRNVSSLATRPPFPGLGWTGCGDPPAGWLVSPLPCAALGSALAGAGDPDRSQSSGVVSCPCGWVAGGWGQPPSQHCHPEGLSKGGCRVC